ncbi:VaFE repeat-containing surface-anchored protein [Candidatus Saccharibacteria bacterium]|nr:VaFE repeat-containing surface-anchored protein [Candidatus Saccharibacteria bacterium]
MQLKSGRSERVKEFFRNRGKLFWIPIFVLAVAGLGFGVYSAVRAITSAGDATTISVANNYRGYTYNSNAIYYGVNEDISWQPWSTRWYNVNGNDAMCLQASRSTPTGSGTASLNTTDVKQVMLATVPSYSAASVAAGGPNYYDLFAAQYNWSSKTSAITNLMTRDTNIKYSSDDSRARTNDSGEEIVKYTDYYYGCNSYYSTGCNQSLAGSLVDSRDAIFAIGHMAASGIYDGDTTGYYALSSDDVAVVKGVVTDINTWFSNNYPNAAAEYESYTTWVDTTHQTVGWLEYKGTPPPPNPTRIRICKKSTSGTLLPNATFKLNLSSAVYYTTGSDGCTDWIEVDATSIYYNETTAPSGYVLYPDEQTCTVTTENADNTCWARDNELTPTAYIKIKKVASPNSSVTYAGLTVQGTVFSVKSGSTEVATITIGSDGTGTTTTALPIGTYIIQEKSATTGFSANSTTMSVTLDSSNTASNPATVDMTGNPFKNDVIKGKISLTTTGYELNSEGGSAPRNLGGVYFTAVNKADPSITYTIGPTASNGSATSPDMVYGTYTVTENRGNANAAYDLISFEVTVNGTSTYSQGTKEDTIPDHPSLATDARNSKSTVSSPSKDIEISATASVTDHITCSGLISGASYRISGELWDGSSLVNTATETFTADSSGGCTTINSNTGDMVFPNFDSYDHRGHTLGIKQRLYKNNGTSGDWVLIAVHNANLQDTREQVKVKNIELSTLATSTRSQDSKKIAAGRVTVNDAVSITGLSNGKSYVIEGVLKDSSNHTVATASNNYSMVSATGATVTDTLSFTFDSTPYVGGDLTVYITLKDSGGTTLAEHSASDGSETVSVLTPVIGTTAINGRDVSLNEHELEVGATTIQDTVTYTGLVSGDIYTIKGEVHKLNSDGTAGSAVISSATKSFTATGEDNHTGETITFDIDTIASCATDNKLILPCKFVVFEYIYFGSNTSPFAKHEDAGDTNQILSVKEPTLATAASDIQNNTKFLPIGTTTVIDSVTYTNLMPGQTYILRGELFDRAAASSTDSPVATAIESFPAASTSGTITIDSFSTFDSTLHYDHTLGENQKKFVVFQKLYFGDVELASHTDADDENQIVQLAPPKIHTNATYKLDEGKLLGVGDVTMKDYIDYEGLVEGEWYMVVGSIIDPETGQPLEIDDEFVENSKTFKADAKGKGTVALEINLNTVPLQGRSFVVYERLYRSQAKHGDGRLLDSHEEALDEGDQTIAVKVARIGTLAKDKADEDNVIDHEKNQTIVDTVEFDGLLMDEEYTLYGYLWDKTNNRPLLDADGKRIDAYATFTTPTKKDNGTLEDIMEFPVDAENLPGVEIVVFEYLFKGDKSAVPIGDDGYPDVEQKITKHDDVDSPSQTIRVSMRVGTQAVDAYDNDQTVGVGKAEIIDNLKYEGVTIGKKYKAKGWLVFKDDPTKKIQSVEVTYTDSCAAPEGEEPEGDDTEPEEGGEEPGEMEGSDEESEEPTECVITREVTYHDIEGEAIFVAGSEGFEETTGSIPITFEIDTRELIGKKVVVFEELYLINDDETEELVAEHKDINDDDQTVTVATPKIRTTATDKADGDQELLYDADVIILDKVEYEGLVAGTKYTLKGQLVDKATGKRISGGLTEVTVTFIPTRDSGYEELEFAINTTGLTGKELVVFEELYIDEYTEPEDKITEHKDLNDKAQTVNVKVDKPNTGLFTRGIEGAVEAGIIVLTGGFFIIGSVVFVSKKRKKLHGTINFE